MTFFIVVLKKVGEVEQLNLIRCDAHIELFERLNQADFQNIEFVDSILGLSQDKTAMLIHGEIKMPTKKVEWELNYYNSTEAKKLEDS